MARALLRLAQQTGKKLDGGILLRIQLSRQDLRADDRDDPFFR